MKLLAFSGSLRKESLNGKLIQTAAKSARELGAEVDLADFSEFDSPSYDGDIEKDGDIPKGIQEFHRRVQNVDGILISSPEYNYSIPGGLKNLIDWASRMKPMPWRKSNIFLMSTSPSLAGGSRGLWQIRIPLEGLGAFVFPQMFSLPSGHNAFDEKGEFSDTKMKERLRENLQSFIETTNALNQIKG